MTYCPLDDFSESFFHVLFVTKHELKAAHPELEFACCVAS